MSLLIFGCGYLGSRVAQTRQSRAPVQFVTRSADFAHACWQVASVRGFVADVTERSTLVPEIFEGVTSILFSVGFDRSRGSIFDVCVHAPSQHCQATSDNDA